MPLSSSSTDWEYIPTTFTVYGTTQMIEAHNGGYKDFDMMELRKAAAKIICRQKYLVFEWCLIRFCLLHPEEAPERYSSFSKITPISFESFDSEIDLYLKNPKFLFRFSLNICSIFDYFFLGISDDLNAGMAMPTYNTDTSPMVPYVVKTEESEDEIRNPHRAYFPHTRFKPMDVKRTKITYVDYVMSNYDLCEVFYSDDFHLHGMDPDTSCEQFAECLLTGLKEDKKLPLLLLWEKVEKVGEAATKSDLDHNWIKESVASLSKLNNKNTSLSIRQKVIKKVFHSPTFVERIIPSSQQDSINVQEAFECMGYNDDVKALNRLECFLKLAFTGRCKVQITDVLYTNSDWIEDYYMLNGHEYKQTYENLKAEIGECCCVNSFKFLNDDGQYYRTGWKRYTSLDQENQIYERKQAMALDATQGRCDVPLDENTQLNSCYSMNAAKKEVRKTKKDAQASMMSKQLQKDDENCSFQETKYVSDLNRNILHGGFIKTENSRLPSLEFISLIQGSNDLFNDIPNELEISREENLKGKELYTKKGNCKPEILEESSLVVHTGFAPTMETGAACADLKNPNEDRFFIEEDLESFTISKLKVEINDEIRKQMSFAKKEFFSYIQNELRDVANKVSVNFEDVRRGIEMQSLRSEMLTFCENMERKLEELKSSLDSRASSIKVAEDTKALEICLKNLEVKMNDNIDVNTQKFDFITNQIKDLNVQSIQEDFTEKYDTLLRALDGIQIHGISENKSSQSDFSTDKNFLNQYEQHKHIESVLNFEEEGKKLDSFYNIEKMIVHFGIERFQQVSLREKFCILDDTPYLKRLDFTLLILYNYIPTRISLEISNSIKSALDKDLKEHISFFSSHPLSSLLKYGTSVLHSIKDDLKAFPDQIIVKPIPFHTLRFEESVSFKRKIAFYLMCYFTKHNGLTDMEQKVYYEQRLTFQMDSRQNAFMIFLFACDRYMSELYFANKILQRYSDRMEGNDSDHSLKNDDYDKKYNPFIQDLDEYAQKMKKALAKRTNRSFNQNLTPFNPFSEEYRRLKHTSTN